MNLLFYVFLFILYLYYIELYYVLFYMNFRGSVLVGNFIICFDCFICFNVDIENFYIIVQEKILVEYGKMFDWNLKVKLIGKRVLEVGWIFVQEIGLMGFFIFEEFIVWWEVMFNVMFFESNLMFGMFFFCLVFVFF